jgi:hypothetical protein
VRRARVQRTDGGVLRFDGGVLSMSGGSATFEFVAICNTSASVCVAGEADRVGGGVGRVCAERWRGEDRWWVG